MIEIENIRGECKMQYEELTQDHLTDIVPLYTQSFNAAPWYDEWTIETASNRLLQMLNCEGYYGLVAYQGKTLVGMILGNHEYYYDGMHFQIKEFCVDDSLRGQGIGSKLFEEFLNRLKQRQIQKVYLLTLKSNVTEGFYLKKGFEANKNIILMDKLI